MDVKRIKTTIKMKLKSTILIVFRLAKACCDIRGREKQNGG